MYLNSVQRFKEIIKILAFYGFGHIVDSKFNEDKAPENLRKAFEELGPTFIKIGQILSTRPDILSAPYIKELSKLQDSVPEDNFSNINKIFFEEFNISIEDAFLNFNRKPLASASISQVYSAKLHNNEEVIVKIQRPEIKEKMNMDLAILRKIFTLGKIKTFDTLIDPKEAIDELINATNLELDFNNEKENIKKFKYFNKNLKCIYVPNTIDKYCSSKIITMEKIHGFKITDTKSLDKLNYDKKDVAHKLAISILKQIFEDGFFHGDPHPGNIFIYEGKICYIDFGIMGTLSSDLKNYLNKAMVAVAFKDVDKLISVLLSIGIKKGYINKNNLFEDINYLFDIYLSTPLKNIKMSTMLQEVFECANRNNISLPKELTMLIRSLIIIEGILEKIDPNIQILDIAIPYVKNNNKINFFKNIDFDELILNSYKTAEDLSKIPTKTVQLLNSILNGRSKIQLNVNNLDRSINELNRMINRIVFALIISSMIIGFSFILNSNIGPKFYDISIIGILGYLIAAFMGFWLLISIIKSGKL
ncbi:protein kinase [Clostridium sporogenes]|uniref:ABC1 kinase family protein n=1 Tax=Clostridium botulinum TaxID=1491 RepID=UPI000717B902|nr:AarF/ABC1/UbiB kinase family protein [Clostridium botulinum]KRU27106.1 protein kinase [Clostridium sporogenes]KRU32239.1 protein kinase [Clostridium sporogenes]KRU34698.1 protein kinase [Clostridium sporogenes]KRU38654.1 protein kinase [Clostridium sporogenes]MBZ1331026.1 AarF/ABC1/UbiB kinase family protein [Clostridium botulinum]